MDETHLTQLGRETRGFASPAEAVLEPQIAPTGLRYERIGFKEPISRATRAKLHKQPAPAAP